jgi:hypothetical protein
MPILSAVEFQEADQVKAALFLIINIVISKS